MPAGNKKKWFILLPLLIVLISALTIGWQLFFRARGYGPVKEIPVTVETLQPAGEGLWRVSPEVLDKVPGARTARAARLKDLRVQKIEVEIVHENGNQVTIRSKGLRESDLLIQRPGNLAAGAAVVPQGMAEARLLRLAIEAGLAGLQDRDLTQSLRFISPDYRDSWGFNYFFIGKLLERAYREFENLRLELASEPELRIQGHQAMVQAKVRLTADYRGRHNYLLGDPREFNALVIQYEKAGPGWRVVNLTGLRPLGFDERFFRLLGGDIGLPLTEDERRDKQAACMPCRDRMAERFGPYRP
jgi:hypothetical protein